MNEQSIFVIWEYSKNLIQTLKMTNYLTKMKEILDHKTRNVY